MQSLEQTCEWAARPFNRKDPGLCGAPATKVIYDPLLGRDKDGNPWPFHICDKHFAEMQNGPLVLSHRAAFYSSTPEELT